MTQEERSKNEVEMLNKIAMANRQPGGLPFVFGAFGDMAGCDGVVEEIVQDPKKGGVMVKFLGCSYYAKGFPEDVVTNMIDLPKAMVSVFPRKILADSLYWKIVFGLRFVFARKAFIHDARIFFNTILTKDIAKIGLPKHKFCVSIRELRRAVDSVLEKRVKTIGAHSDGFLLHGRIDESSKFELWELVANIMELVYHALEYDFAYRLRWQDVFSEFNKLALIHNPRKEILRVFDILISREPKHGIAYKWKEIRMLLSIALLSKTARCFARDVILETNLSKIALDESDWYFCLERQSYNAQGLSLEKRLAIKNSIDKNLGHIKLVFDLIKDQYGEMKAVNIRMAQ